MTIGHLFNRQFIIRTLKDIGGIKNQLYATATFDAHYQRLDENTQSVAVQLYGATHKMWCDISETVKDGDQVEDDEGNIYQIVAVIKKEPSLAINEHLEVLLRLYNS